MSNTIVGGAYQDAAGNWHDARGEPLKGDQVARFQERAQQRQQELALIEHQQQALAARSNPVASALMQVLGLRSAPTPQAPPHPTEADVLLEQEQARETDVQANAEQAERERAERGRPIEEPRQEQRGGPVRRGRG